MEPGKQDVYFVDVQSLAFLPRYPVICKCHFEYWTSSSRPDCNCTLLMQGTFLLYFPVSIYPVCLYSCCALGLSQIHYNLELFLRVLQNYMKNSDSVPNFGNWTYLENRPCREHLTFQHSCKSLFVLQYLVLFGKCQDHLHSMSFWITLLQWQLFPLYSQDRFVLYQDLYLLFLVQRLHLQDILPD